MSWSINISGHKDHESDQAAEDFETEIANKATEFVASLSDHGVSGATFYGGRVNRNLMSPSTATPDEPVIDDDPDQDEGE